MARFTLLAAILVVAEVGSAGAAPTVYPTGTTVYDPSATWNGYTVLSPLGTQAVLVIDMNGSVVKRWDGYDNSAGGPARVLPGGMVIAATGARAPHQESLEIVQRDFAGNVVWQFGHNVQVQMPDGKTIWSVRQHHDWQRADFPAGYYSPGAEPAAVAGRMLMLTHISHTLPDVADVPLEDDRLIEITPDGKIAWEWTAGNHIGEMGFSAAARAAIKASPGPNAARTGFDWLHLNAATY
ncbi:MAG TPA: aryl-sulfate sulfotransferase, partial [Steroidobacteraceae bacterium]|nr:aryl-sulfate sulfotransferase [Steroidobacteraceae bacterium]